MQGCRNEVVRTYFVYTAVSTIDVKCLSPVRRPSVFSTRSWAACSQSFKLC